MMDEVLIERFAWVGKKIRLDISTEIELFGRKYSPEEYVSLCFGLSSIVTTIFLPVGIEAVLIFPVLFSVLLHLARAQHKRKMADIEKHLPLFLKTMAFEHSIGIPFTRIKKDLSQGFGVLSKELRKTGDFETIVKRYPSSYLKRAVPLINVLEKVGSGERELLELSDEILEEQELKTKEFNKKLIMYGLVLVGTSALLPGMFQMYLTVGSKFLEIEISREFILLLYGVIFPVINGGIVWMIESKKPSHMH